MRYFKKIPGERVYLSPLNTGDAEIYTRWLNDFAVADGLGHSSGMINVQGEGEWLEKNRGEYQFAIVSQADDSLLGSCGIGELDQLRQCCEVGIFIGEAEDRGRGYGSEALRLLLGYAFDYLNIRTALLKVFAFNRQAIACYKKVGFREIGLRRQSYFLKGEFHDTLYMDILREEFKANK